jgi:hypothetical protein
MRIDSESIAITKRGNRLPMLVVTRALRSVS